MHTCRDLDSKLEITVSYDVSENCVIYSFSDNPTIHKVPKGESILYGGLGHMASVLLTEEITRRKEQAEQALPPLERAQRYLKESWRQEDQVTHKVLGCIVEHLIAIDKPK